MRLLMLALITALTFSCKARVDDSAALDEGDQQGGASIDLKDVLRGVETTAETAENLFEKIPEDFLKGAVKLYCMLSPNQVLKDISGFSISGTAMTGVWPGNPFGVGGGVEYAIMMENGEFVGVPYAVWQNQYGGYPPGPASGGVNVSVIWGCKDTKHYSGYFLQPTVAGFSANLGMDDEFLYAAYHYMGKKANQLEAKMKGELYQDPDKPKAIDDFRIAYIYAEKEIQKLLGHVQSGFNGSSGFKSTTFTSFMNELKKETYSKHLKDETERPYDLIQKLLKDEMTLARSFRNMVDSMALLRTFSQVTENTKKIANDFERRYSEDLVKRTVNEAFAITADESARLAKLLFPTIYYAGYLKDKTGWQKVKAWMANKPVTDWLVWNPPLRASANKFDDFLNNYKNYRRSSRAKALTKERDAVANWAKRLVSMMEKKRLAVAGMRLVAVEWWHQMNRAGLAGFNFDQKIGGTNSGPKGFKGCNSFSTTLVSAGSGGATINLRSFGSAVLAPVPFVGPIAVGKNIVRTLRKGNFKNSGLRLSRYYEMSKYKKKIRTYGLPSVFRMIQGLNRAVDKLSCKHVDRKGFWDSFIGTGTVTPR